MIAVIITVPDQRGKGFGTTAHRLLVAEIFRSRPEIEKIEAMTAVGNKAERSVLKKVGFAVEGIARSKWRLRGKLTDMALYGVLRAEYTSLPNY